MKFTILFSKHPLVSAIAVAAAFSLGSTDLSADVVIVYTIGSNPAGNALDQGGNNIGGITSITWNHTWLGGPGGLLTIQAEGIDGGPGAPGGGEHDLVFFNGVNLGELTQQSFYASVFNLQPGPGNVPGITDISFSVFDVSALVLPGVNVVRVDVDPGNWINEIEVSTLSSASSVPDGGATIALLGCGITAIAGLRRKLSNS